VKILWTYKKIVHIKRDLRNECLSENYVANVLK